MTFSILTPTQNRDRIEAIKYRTAKAKNKSTHQTRKGESCVFLCKGGIDDN
jgi:hypothetical protein